MAGLIGNQVKKGVGFDGRGREHGRGGLS